MHKELFDDAIGEVPPSTIDVEAVITRGRRADRLRRVANPVVAAGVAVVLLTGAVAYTMTRDSGGGASVGTTSPTSSATAPQTTGSSWAVTSEPAKAPPACDRTDLESASEVSSRLTQVATEALQAQRPGVTLVANPGMEYPAGTPRGPLEFFQVNHDDTLEDRPICDGSSYFMSRATINAPEGAGNILVAVQPAYDDGLPGPCGATEQQSCEEVPGPNGEHIFKSTSVFDSGVTHHRADVTRPDDTEVTIIVENVGTSAKSDEAASAPAPPLNHDQLIAIATNPGMTLFP